MSKRKNSGGGSAAAQKKQVHPLLKAIAFIIVLAVVAYLTASISIGLVKSGKPEWNPVNWKVTTPGGTDTGDDGNDNPVIAVGSDGEAIRAGSAYSLRRSADNGITYLTEAQNNQTYVPDGEIIVTAELSNEYINGAFDWSVDFVDPAAEWAVGKVADYYVSVEPVAGDSTSATLRYLAPFGEQIRLTATLRGSDSSDSCTIDCVKQVTSFSVKSYDTDFGDTNTFGISIVFGLGTVTGNFKFNHGYVAVEEAFRTYVQSYLKFDVAFKTMSFYADDVTWTDSYNSGALCECGDVAYSMFIEGFDEYDDAHKEAIYYAWFTAFDKDYDGGSNVVFDINYIYLYNGATISGFIDSDCIGYLSGSNYGYDIAPNTQLNKNYVF